MIKVSKDSIEISHERFLSDSSTGIVFYLNLLILHNNGILTLDLLRKSINTDLPSNDLFLVILLFFLVTTIGMVISVLSWCFLEYLYVIFFEKIWFNNKVPLKLLQMSGIFDEVVKKFGLNYNNWHSSVTNAELFLEMKGISVSKLLIQRGMRIFLRNLVLIGLIDIVFLLSSKLIFDAILVLLSCFILLLISGFIGFYSNAGFIIKYDIHKA